MSAKLTVVFFIILCLEAGLALIILPWAGWWFGLGDWGDNFLLVYAAQKTGFQSLQSAISSGWIRGAVTGLGLLNLLMAFWEMAHFRETVRALQTHHAAPAKEPSAEENVSPTTDAADLSNYERRDDARNDSGQ